MEKKTSQGNFSSDKDWREIPDQIELSQMPRATHRPGGKQLVVPIVADNPFLHWVPPELTSEYNRYVAQMAQDIRTDRQS